MSTITSGAIQSTSSTFNDSQATVSVTVNGNALDGYTLSNFPVYNPAGFISIPMPGRLCFSHISSSGTTGYVMGFANEAPDPAVATNNIADLVEGESAIFETANFNYNIKSKLHGLISTFTNSSEDIINTNVAISENVVTILTDIISEIVALEDAYNILVAKFNAFNATFQAHVHSGVTPGDPTQFSGGTTTPFPNNATYAAQSNFTRDQTFINKSPSQMYINTNGALIV